MTNTPASTRGLGRDGRRMFAGMVFVQGASGSYQTLWPLYIAALGASPAQVGLVLGLTGIIRLAALIPSGTLVDHVSLKHVIIAGQVVSAVALIVYAVMQQWWQLILAGSVFAVGAATFPAILAMTASIAGHGPDRARRFTLINTVAAAIGLLITPVIGGVIAAEVSIRAVFFFAAVLSAAAIVFFAGLSDTTEAHMNVGNATYLSTLRQPAILRWCLLEMVAIFSLELGMSLIPNYLHGVHHVSDGVIGAFASLSAVGSMAIGMLVHRVHRFRHPLLGIGLALASVAVAFVLLTLGSDLLTFAVAYVLLGGFLATWTLFESALSGIATREYHARTYAIAELLSSTGYALAPFLAGFLYHYNPRAPMIGGLTMTVLLLLTLLSTTRGKFFTGVQETDAAN